MSWNLGLPSISSTFYASIFCVKFWHQKISNPKHSFAIFGAKISYKKHVRKTLMILTPTWQKNQERFPFFEWLNTSLTNHSISRYNPLSGLEWNLSNAKIWIWKNRKRPFKKDETLFIFMTPLRCALTFYNYNKESYFKA